MTEQKSFGIAILVWWFTGAIGGHRVYIQEKFSVLLWYWLLAIVTLGIFPLVDAFRIKKMIMEVNK